MLLNKPQPAERHSSQVFADYGITGYMVHGSGPADDKLHLNISPWRWIPLGADGELSAQQLDEGAEATGVACVLGDLAEMQDDAYIRIHSQCLTGEMFDSLLCECGPQLREAQRRILLAGKGIIFYLFQEGRGAGLGPKLYAYYLAQSEHLDTVEAYKRQGLPPDLREYGAVVRFLGAHDIQQVTIMTNNPEKIAPITAAGIICVREALITDIRPENADYMGTKATKMGHQLAASNYSSLVVSSYRESD